MTSTGDVSRTSARPSCRSDDRQSAKIHSSLAAFVSLIAFLLIGYLFWPRVDNYFVSANTEIVVFAVADSDGATSSLIEHAEIVDRTDGRKIRGVRLHIERGATVTARRHRRGALELEFVAPPNVPVAARLLLPEGSEIVLGSGHGMRVYFNEHDSIFMLAFDGAVTIGAEPGPRVDNILLNGTVAIIERQPIFKERFLLDRVELEPGIVLKFKSVNKQIAGKLETVVLLRVDPSDGNEATAIQVTANSAADAVEIIRYGAADYSISPSPWARIKTDPARIARPQ